MLAFVLVLVIRTIQDIVGLNFSRSRLYDRRIPLAVDEVIKSGKGSVKVLNCKDRWYGMTYREDMDSVREAMKNMVEEGYYEGL